MLEAVTKYRGSTNQGCGGTQTCSKAEGGVMIMASDNVFKIKRGSLVGTVLWMRVSDRHEDRMEQITRGGGYVDTVYRSDSVETVIEKLVMAQRGGELGIEGREMCRQPEGIGITSQEGRVIRLIGCGLDPKAIARALAIQPKTVSAHKCNVMRKLGLRRTQDLYRWLQLNELLKLQSK
ncbi:helix-turn-helix domain-containing protein [Serratia liquefaciens]|jgi:DNA-binding NarL/FixJ family response regulator|uniref:helix-turn-helix domain-containing protein n=1 Tax=Serratia liquefaciens TaxID=614 RepID=UPI0038152808